MRSGRIEKHVGYSVFFTLQKNGKQNFFGCSALVNGLNIRHAENIRSRLYNVLIANGTRIRLVAEHDACPLIGTHSVGAAVGKTVDINVLSVKPKKVIMCSLNLFFSFFSRQHLKRLYALNTKRFGNISWFHNFLLILVSNLF